MSINNLSIAYSKIDSFQSFSGITFKGLSKIASKNKY